jgi:hypothetical protein
LGEEYGKALLVVERNNHGLAVLAHLQMEQEGRRGYAGPVYAQNGQAGWLTTAASRPAMLERLGALLEEQAEIFMSEQLLRECRSFVRLANGCTGARAGTHDDRVMAMAIGLGAREQLLASSF